ncbi:unnamed protein product [Caenorhabditis angaria]|uniref:Ground-like domain-containing protein n=1 Tax=Caenorhabditis angaria TaxID=860376 RepID=A0A9P1IV46_9PELO|nr:unnamed protein product [Caenorhabditis angaria]
MKCLILIGFVGAAIIPSPDEPKPLDEPPLASFSLDELENPRGPTPTDITTKANVKSNSDIPVSRKRVRLHSKSSKNREAEILERKCNDQNLEEILMRSITPSLSTSKMIISERASRDYGTVFDVICARGRFSYYVEASNYCEVTVGGITCFAYRSSASSRVAAAAERV